MTGERCRFDAFNVCTGKETSINQLAVQVKAAFKSEAEIKHNAARDGEILKSVCNPAKVER
jgi:nucleoside-diphosphate-sugar epimerase